MKKLLIILAIVLLFNSCSHAVPEKTDLWTVGFASREIVHDDVNSHVYYVAGYKNENIATGVLDNQTVKALYLKANDSELLLISVDCIGLCSGQIEKIRSALPRELRSVTHVISTHTHAGVDTLGLWGPLAIDGKDGEFMQKLYSLSVEAAKEAYNNTKEGRLYYASSTQGIEDLLQDSRYPFVYDKALHQIRFEPTDGGDGVRIINYAAHAESLRGDNTKISADFPRYIADTVKEKTGDDILFLPGAIGGLIMTKRLTDENSREYPVEENVVKTGELLALSALSITEEKAIPASLEIITENIEIPLENKVFVAMRALGVLENKIAKSQDGEYGLSVKTSVSLIKIGDLSIVCVPGEIFPELVYEKGADFGVSSSLKELFGDDLLVVGLFDDEIGYIVPPNDFRLSSKAAYIDTEKDEYGENHYEETNSIGPECAEYIIKAFTKIKEKIS